MNWILRNIGIHLWLATLFTVPVVFFLLPFLKQIFPGLNPATATIVIFICLFSGIGSAMDIIARKAVVNLIREGQTWERSGVVQKAKKAYLRAIRIYDTFLFWPFFSRQTAGMICGAIAKFNVNEDKENPNFALASVVYLKLHPEDKDAALIWLNQLRRKTFVTPMEQEVLTLVVQQHYDNPLFSQITADIFLRLERKDFTAKKFYRYLMAASKFKDRYETRIQDLIGGIDEIDTHKKSLKDEKTFKQIESFVPVKMTIQKKIHTGALVQKIINNLVVFFRERISNLIGLFKIGMVWIGSLLSFIVLSLGKSYTWIKENPKAQGYLKIAFLSIAFLWLAFFMINTLTHMFKSKTVEKTSEKQIQAQVAKPFTIQVAAYLKQKHADRYVGLLKKKGIEAGVKKMDGGGKTWYLVRVSQFTDKKSAAEYGKRLKQEKIIDDFFVNNK
ncbi:MAG: SPOR domain-containing protein [Desulfobacula sp.]|nr:SPOR domain-containing protein [Desulfobacula sp.]